MDDSWGEVFLCARVPGGAPGVLSSGKVHDTGVTGFVHPHVNMSISPLKGII